MNRLTRAVAVIGAAALTVPVWAVPASAATLTETASVGAYYLSSNPGTVVVPGPVGSVKAPDNAKSADGVAQDDLAVAVVAANTGQPDKFSALMWDLLDLLPGATVSKATVTIPFSTKGESRSTDKNAALVVACLAGPEGFGDADGEPFQDAPSALCEDASATATSVEGNNALEFDITAIAQKWNDGMNTGLVLYPSKDGFAKPFQTVFGDKSTARLTLAFTGGEVLDDVPVDVDDFGEADTLSSGDTFTTGADGGFDSGSGGGSFDTGSFGSTGSDASFSGGSTLDLPSLPTGQDPTVAGQDPVTAAPQPVVRTGAGVAPMGFDTVTWLAILGGAALLFVVSLALGAPAAPAGAAGANVRPGGVASALASRRGGSLAGLRA